MKESIEINLECVFCSSTQFELPQEGYKPEQGEMIKCGNCGRLNDFSSIYEVAISNGVETVKKDAMKYAEDELKKMFKKNGFNIK